MESNQKQQLNPRFPFKSGKDTDLLTVEIRSDRLILRPAWLGLAPEIFKEFNSDITRYMNPGPAKEQGETEAVIRNFRAKMAHGSDLFLAILDGDTAEFLGACGLHGSLDGMDAEFGVWLKKSAQGRGIGREAIQALYHWACHNCNFRFFYYPVDRRNISSVKIAQSLKGEVIEEKISPTLWGGELEEVLFRIAPIESK